MTRTGRFRVRWGKPGEKILCVRPHCGAWIATFSPIRPGGPPAKVTPRQGRDLGYRNQLPGARPIEAAVPPDQRVHPSLPDRIVFATCKRCALVHAIDGRTGAVVAAGDDSNHLSPFPPAPSI